MSALDVTHRLIAPQWLGPRIVLFEDAAVADELFPLSVMRPAWEIRAGLGCLREWLSALRPGGAQVALRPRESLRRLATQLAGFSDKWSDSRADVVFLSGRITSLPAVPQTPAALLDRGGRVLWTRMTGAAASSLLDLAGTELAEALVKQIAGGVPLESVGGHSARYVWDFMADNDKLLLAGFGSPTEKLLGSSRFTVGGGVAVIGSHPAYVGEGSHLYPGVVLDTSDGPIWIGREVTVEPHTFLRGPLAFGDHGRIKAGTTLYTNSTFGPHCRVSGEISNSIMQGYVNKQHAGFLGNSHLGEWVNLGADTTVSNLRNDYGNVKVKLPHDLVDSGRQFVGLLCGDHTKTGINTMFNTATVVGVGANVFGAGYPARHIPSFTWGGVRGSHIEPLERTLESARIAMPRRDRELSQAEIEVLTEHYMHITKQEK